MKLQPVQHSAEVRPIQAPGRRQLYVGSCSAGDFTGDNRTSPERAMSDACKHSAGHSTKVTYEATLILRVEARNNQEAIANLRRMLIRLGTRRGFLARSLAELRPISTKVGA